MYFLFSPQRVDGGGNSPAKFAHFSEILHIVRFQEETSKKLRYPEYSLKYWIFVFFFFFFRLNLLSGDLAEESVHKLVLPVKLC